ncbi:hypothetical protein PG996_011288 [Apiospora saccharicola]|uniref:Uncharacterized protein n=1 Tax=Apiospora saccharicola TaxID=335842 RepID=A0ABR1UGW1_9PEZI
MRFFVTFRSPKSLFPSLGECGDLIKDAVDISRDNPVHEPLWLERSDIQYHKLANISKIPHTNEGECNKARVHDWGSKGDTAAKVILRSLATASRLSSPFSTVPSFLQAIDAPRDIPVNHDER